MQTIRLQVTSQVGLHARPASEFVKLAAQFNADLHVRNATSNSASVDAKSILSVLTLGVEQGHEIEISGDGADEAEALEALRTLVETDFGE